MCDSVLLIYEAESVYRQILKFWRSVLLSFSRVEMIVNSYIIFTRTVRIKSLTKRHNPEEWNRQVHHRNKLKIHINSRKRDGQRACNLSLKGFRTAFPVLGNEITSVNFHSCLSYSLCKSHAPLLCCHVWSAPLYNIFPHYLQDGTICGRNFLNIK